MKIRVFQSDKGDCLLLTSRTGATMLVDGGIAAAFTTHVQPFLGEMAADQQALDLVYVSHIDQDHIAGVLKLLDNTMLWRVHDYRTSKGLGTKAPSVPRMPRIGAIWHNAFSTLLGENAGAAEELLAQSSRVLSLSAENTWAELAASHQELAYSISEAVRVSRRIAADQLSIPLNAQFDGKLILVREPADAATRLGGMAISVIGPFARDVEVLKKEWNDWLRRNKAAVAALKARARDDATRIGQSGDMLASGLDVFLRQLGDRKSVTAPNLASVMLLVEERGKRVLLTGDGHADDILAGLEHQGALEAGKTLQLDVLKVQHHGSEYNIHQRFCERVFADHYIFCGNGEHENPDFEVVKLLVDTNRSAWPGKPYKLWFSCSESQAPEGEPRKHMQALTRQVMGHAADSGGLLSYEFLEASSFELTP